MKQSRADLVQEARRLRTQGLMLREIAQRMEMSISGVSAYLADPDLSKQRARRKRYQGICSTCGTATDGSNGRRKAPTTCLNCRRVEKKERNELLLEMWEAGEPTWHIAESLDMSESAVTAWIDNQRRRKGAKIAKRRLGGSAEARQARHRRLVKLREEGHSAEEIAEITGMKSAQSVKQAFYYLRRHKGWSVPDEPAHRSEVAA